MKALALRWSWLACVLALAACARSREQVPQQTVAGTETSAGTSAVGVQAGTGVFVDDSMPVAGAFEDPVAGQMGTDPGAGDGGQGVANQSGAGGSSAPQPEPLPPAPSCDLQLGSCPASRSEAWQVLLDAAAFGDGARFVGMGGLAVLVAGGDAAFRVVVLGRDWEENNPDVVLAFPEGDLEGIDVMSSWGRVFALACDPVAARCTVLRGTDGSDGSLPTMVELPGGELPASFEPRGIVFDNARAPQGVCVYGNGLLCQQQGSWVEAIPMEADLQLNDVAIDWERSLAVGTHGRYFQRLSTPSDALGPWVEQLPLADVELTSALAGPSGGVIIGDGRVQAALGDLAHALGCGTPDDLGVFVSEGIAVTRDGAVLYHATSQTALTGTVTRFPGGPGEFCEHQQLLIGDVLDATTAPCGLATNPRVRSERFIIGWDGCPVG